MKQTRRGFLGSFATIAAAVTLAPAVKVEAAPAKEPMIYESGPGGVTSARPMPMWMQHLHQDAPPTFEIEPYTIHHLPGRIVPLI